jgi:hypothetical protein
MRIELSLTLGAKGRHVLSLARNICSIFGRGIGSCGLCPGSSAGTLAYTRRAKRRADRNQCVTAVSGVRQPDWLRGTPREVGTPMVGPAT